jgi:predicted NodU family carbamoyl transferase
MLFTYHARTDALAAVTHVNGTARIQTVTAATNRRLNDLLVAFRARTGYGVLCNTSLNFNGKGFINNIRDLDTYASEHGLDGFVVEGRAYLARASDRYQGYLKRSQRSAAAAVSSDASGAASAQRQCAAESIRFLDPGQANRTC